MSCLLEGRILRSGSASLTCECITTHSPRGATSDIPKDRRSSSDFGGGNGRAGPRPSHASQAESRRNAASAVPQETAHADATAENRHTGLESFARLVTPDSWVRIQACAELKSERDGTIAAKSG